MLAGSLGSYSSKSAVSDSSPLILYARIDRLDLLRALFDAVWIPPAVWREVVTSAAGRIGAQELRHAAWIRQQPLLDAELPPEAASLHPGEAEVIALAISLPAAVPLLLDDLRARRVAQNLGFVVIGSGGILVRAKEAGLIPLLRPTLDELMDAGLHLSDSVVRSLLLVAGEH